jgi:hypothetical protein
MFKWIMANKLRAFERENDYDASYLHEVLDLDPSALLRFGRATSLGKYRKDVPLDAYFAATLTSSLLADCGPCTQLGVRFALGAGVAAPVVAAIIAGDETGMSPGAALSARFARALLARAPETDEYREQITQRWGRRAVLALTFGIMTSQMYPTLKYALGHGKACTRVVVADQTITPRRLATATT